MSSAGKMSPRQSCLAESLFEPTQQPRLGFSGADGPDLGRGERSPRETPFLAEPGPLGGGGAGAFGRGAGLRRAAFQMQREMEGRPGGGGMGKEKETEPTSFSEM